MTATRERALQTGEVTPVTTKKPENTKINQNTGRLLDKLHDAYRVHTTVADVHEQDLMVGRKVRHALRAALKATTLGKQPNAVIEAATDKAQQSFNRYLTRSL